MATFTQNPQNQAAKNQIELQKALNPVVMLNLKTGEFNDRFEGDVKKFFPNFEMKDAYSLQVADIFSSMVITQVDGKPKIVGMHGSNYQLTTNQDLIGKAVQQLNNEFGEGGYAVTVKNLDDRQFKIDFIVNNKTIGLPKVGKNDGVNLKYSIINSYDGRVKPDVKVGLWRMVCTNGLHAFAFESASNGKKHVDTLSIDLSKIENQIDEAKSKIQKFEKLRERALTTKEAQEALEFVKEQKTMFQVRQLETVEQIYNSEITKLGETEGNAWLLYNGFNNVLNHSYNETVTPQQITEIDTRMLNFITDRFGIAMN